MAEMVDMAKTAEELKQDGYNMPAVGGSEPDMPKYPYGLSICLDEGCLQKLEAAGEDDHPDVGALVHGHFIGEVTSVSKNATTNGERHRVEIQITHLALEDEDLENEEEDEGEESSAQPYKNMYHEGE